MKKSLNKLVPTVGNPYTPTKTNQVKKEKKKEQVKNAINIYQKINDVIDNNIAKYESILSLDREKDLNFQLAVNQKVIGVLTALKNEINNAEKVVDRETKKMINKEK